MSDHLPPSTRFASISPNAGQTMLDYDFPLAEESGMTVIRLRGGTEEKLELGVDFIFPMGVGGPGGGSLQLVMPAQEGDTYLLVGLERLARLSEHLQTQNFSTEKINEDLDAGVRRDQELRRDVDRAVKVPYGQPGLQVESIPEGHFWRRGPNGMEDAGPAAQQGLSAYEIAVANGFEGTAAEWLETLTGPQGGFQKLPTWNSGDTYDEDEIVIRDSAWFRSLIPNNVGRDPLTDASWELAYRLSGGTLTDRLTVAVGTTEHASVVFPSSGSTDVPVGLGNMFFRAGSLQMDMNTGEGLQRHTFLTDRRRFRTRSITPNWRSYNNAISGKAPLPIDNTLPQANEVSDIWAFVIAAKHSPSARHHIEVSGTLFAGPTNTPDLAALCIFAGEVCIETMPLPGLVGGKFHPFSFTAVHAPPNYDDVTYSLRVGTSTGSGSSDGTGNVFLNGNGSGSLFAGTMSTKMLVVETTS